MSLNHNIVRQVEVEGARKACEMDRTVAWVAGAERGGKVGRNTGVVASAPSFPLALRARV